MSRSQRRKFGIAVYLSVGALAVALAVIGVNYAQGALRDLALNLATDFLGVALLFFIVNQFFGLDAEGAASDRVEALLRQIERKQSILASSAEARQRFPVKELLASARQADILGYSLKGFLDEYRNLLTERVQEGTKVRVLVIKPSSQAHAVIQENSRLFTFDAEIELSLGYVRQIKELLSKQGGQVKGTFELKLTSWIPSCALVIIDPTLETGIVKVAINSPYYKTHPKDRLYLVLEKQEQPLWFDYYAGEFNWTLNNRPATVSP